jgi:hypothetical protein
MATNAAAAFGGIETAQSGNRYPFLDGNGVHILTLEQAILRNTRANGQCFFADFQVSGSSSFVVGSGRTMMRIPARDGHMGSIKALAEVLLQALAHRIEALLPVDTARAHTTVAVAVFTLTGQNMNVSDVDADVVAYALDALRSKASVTPDVMGRICDQSGAMFRGLPLKCTSDQVKTQKNKDFTALNWSVPSADDLAQFGLK